jgi:WD40 repeat protein
MGHKNRVLSVAFSPGGGILASGSDDKTIRLWDLKTYKPLDSPLTHEGYVGSVAFSPDGAILASGSNGGTIRLWDSNTRKKMGPPLICHEGWVGCVVFSQDGHILASGGEDGFICLWDMDVESWIRRACQLANRNLTRNEWRQYLGNLPYRVTCPDLQVTEE